MMNKVIINLLTKNKESESKSDEFSNENFHSNNKLSFGFNKKFS